MIKLVAFDWNGTLFADTFAVHDSNGEVFKLLNVSLLSFKDFQKYFDVPVKKLYLAAGVPEEVLDKKAKEIADTFHSFYEQRAEKVRTRANTKQLLAWLLKSKIDRVIFSNHIVEPIKKQLKRLKIDGYFSAVLANAHLEAAFKGRNKKESLKKYMLENNLLPNEVLIIGDTIEEIEIGKELGSVTVAITHGNCSTLRLKKAKPSYLINGLKNVIYIIKGINNRIE